MYSSNIVALAALLATTSAGAIQGFNYGATHTDGSAKSQDDFQSEFAAAKKLAGTNGDFTSARLYTMIQGGSTSDVTSAIPAAIAEGTHLLLGLWASGDTFQNELKALEAAMDKYPELAKIVDGISVGSEDLYRISPTGIKNKSGIGAGPDTLASYIKQVKSKLSGSPLKDIKVGHVDTWTAWVNDTNSAVVDACDWVGVDAYPYFQSEMSNDISDGPSLFMDALAQTKSHSKGKPVWVTETGWPVSGKTENKAVPNVANAKEYWQQVGCVELFGKINTWWFTIQDADPTTPNPSFGLVGSDINGKPAYDLSCKGVKANAKTNSSSSSDDASATGSASSSSSTGSSDSGSPGASGASSSTSSAASSSPSGNAASMQTAGFVSIAAAIAAAVALF